MPGRALIERRPWLLASIVLAIAYFLLEGSRLPGLYLIALKGLPVALLAVYALLRHQGVDGRMIAGVMAIGAAGDVAMELDLMAGGAAFACAHLLAIALFMKHRRERITTSQRLFGLALLLVTPVIAWSLPAERATAPLVAAYALVLGAMAGAAWTSAFPRYRVGLGAVLFAVSDLLIFARLGPWADSAVPGWTIWPAYYTAQFLICTGVVQTLRRWSLAK
ncbi:MAG: lysoplasmalogenase [Novosphingobium sp.]|nr:lysoplasmalogenase [Novosphingobium sp.]